MNHCQEVLLDNSDHSNNTFCNSLEQNVTLVQNNNALVTHVVNTYPKKIQQYIKTAFNINTKEQRPFSYFDFPNLSNANFRQIRHKLRDNIVRVTKTHPARYILKGISIPESTHKVTLDPMSVGQNYYDLLNSLKNVEPCIHDIKIKIPNTKLHALLVKKGHTPHSINKSIKINFPDIDNNKKTTILVYPNTVIIDIGCTYKPLIYNTSTIWLLHEHLSKTAFYLESSAGNSLELPPVNSWIMTHQHLNKDGSFSICGQSFEFKIEDVNTGLIRFYSKRFKDGTTKPRLEQIQTPQNSIEDEMKRAMFSGTSN